MSHEISQRENGMAEMAFTGPRSAIWHGLGQQLDVGASIDDWKKQAGMDWEIFESPLFYNSVEEDNVRVHGYPGSKVVFRSDDQSPLGIVGDNFKLVQPGEVLEFFRDLTEEHGFQLSTAGTLFGGRRFWALADTGKSAEVTAGDRIDAHLLLTTACDGSMSTQARFTTTRVVCNNTLTMALAGNSTRPIVRVTHKRAFDPTEVKIEMGVLDKAWVDFMNTMRKLANTKMGPAKTREFFEKEIFDPKLPRHEQGWGAEREVDRLIDLALSGSGADMHAGTAFGAMCAITEHYTHGSGRRTPDHQFWSAYVDDSYKSKMANDLIKELA